MKICKAAFLAHALSGSDIFPVPDSVVSNMWLRVIATAWPMLIAHYLMTFICKHKSLECLKLVTRLSRITRINQIGYQGG